MRVSPRLAIVRVVLSLAFVAIVTAVAGRALSVNASTAGFVYLIVILALATAWGRVEAVAASVLAVLCYNFFFLPPVGKFTIAEPQNWVALFTFLITALVASHLSDRAKRQAAEAKERQRETEQLYALSRAILLSEPNQSIGSHAVNHIAQIFECAGVALYDEPTAEIFRGGTDDLPGIEASLKQVVIQGTAIQAAGSETLVAPVTLGGRPIGGLALKSISISDGALQALLNLVAIALERVRTENAANRAEVARQSEEFKSTLLDAIAHEFKTPLTSIKAASTSILNGAVAPPAEVHEMATIIDEETDRLSRLVTEAVRMSQIDAGKFRIERQAIVLRSLLSNLADQFGPRLDGRELRIDADEGLPPICGDPDLLTLAFRQLIDNGLKYSAAAIEIATGVEGRMVSATVRDHGPGIPERDRERIFDKYYRRPSSRDSVPGSGLGLHIAREILRAHGGDLWVEDAAGDGTLFHATIPMLEGTPQP